jgi:hypothetical protein
VTLSTFTEPGGMVVIRLSFFDVFSFHSAVTAST